MKRELEKNLVIKRNYNEHYFVETKIHRKEDGSTEFIEVWTNNPQNAKLFWLEEDAQEYIQTYGMNPEYAAGLISIVRVPVWN